MKILGTGLSGLVGSRTVELLKDKYEFDSSTEDITDQELISDRIKSSDAAIVLHLAAKTDVDGCEKEKSLRETSEAWKVNVLGTQNIAKACFESNKKLIYISTDFVFDGEKEDGYVEEDVPNPLNWYAKTKYEGELAVQSFGDNYIIARISYPYRANFERKDLVRGLIAKLIEGASLSMITDHIMTPTFIDDIAYALDVLIEENLKGIFHIVGSEQISPYDLAIKICNIFGFDENKIIKTTRAEFFKDRAPRAFHLYVRNDKINRLGISMKGIDLGLLEVKKEII